MPIHQNSTKTGLICIDSIFFNADGTIQKVTPTNRGVGLTDALNEIQIDRYSAISDKGVSIEFNDTLNTFNGWKSILDSKGAWIKYNSVGFDKKLKKVLVKATSNSGGTIEIRLDNVDGPVVAEVNIPKSTDWKMVESKISKINRGNHDLVFVLKDDNPVEIDWIRFKN